MAAVDFIGLAFRVKVHDQLAADHPQAGMPLSHADVVKAEGVTVRAAAGEFLDGVADAEKPGEIVQYRAGVRLERRTASRQSAAAGKWGRSAQVPAADAHRLAGTRMPRDGDAVRVSQFRQVHLVGGRLIRRRLCRRGAGCAHVPQGLIGPEGVRRSRAHENCAKSRRSGDDCRKLHKCLLEKIHHGQGSVKSRPPRVSRHRSRKFFRICLPFCVRMDSG